MEVGDSFVYRLAEGEKMSSQITAIYKIAKEASAKVSCRKSDDNSSFRVWRVVNTNGVEA